MAIGTIAAIALGAGAIGSAAINKSASNKAADAATQAADQSAQVQREQLQAAQQALSPYQQAGIPATNAINALLGLSPTATYSQPTQQPNALAAYGQPQTAATEGAWWQRGDLNGEDYGQNLPWTYGQGMDPNGSGQMSATNSVSTQISPQTAFDNYRNSTGYQFRLNQGMNAVNSGWAGRGLLQSGAALKSLNDYGQGMASAEFGNYLGALGNQQALGQSSASALAGVGQNYANSLASINSSKADAIGNAALLNARNTSGMFNSLASGILRYG